MIWLALAFAQDITITADLCRATPEDPAPACLVTCALDAATPPACVLTPASAADAGWTCEVDGDGCRLVSPPEPVPPPESP